MLQVWKAETRGKTDAGWLDGRYTFSFVRYYDPDRMGVGSLRVINDDRIAPGGGFPTHPHADMEIITYVLSGALRHDDSTGGGSVLRAGEVQAMTAGRGITHSEKNDSDAEPVHLIQIWIEPDRRALDPGYRDAPLPEVEQPCFIQKIAGPAGSGAALDIHQDALLLRACWGEAGELHFETGADRTGFIQVVRGRLTAGGQSMTEGDSAIIPSGARLVLAADAEAEALLFDLAGPTAP